MSCVTDCFDFGRGSVDGVGQLEITLGVDDGVNGKVLILINLNVAFGD